MQVAVSGTGVAAAGGIELAYSLTELRLLLLLVLAGLGYLLVVGQAYSLVVEPPNINIKYGIAIK